MNHKLIIVTALFIIAFTLIGVIGFNLLKIDKTVDSISIQFDLSKDQQLD